MYNDEIKRYNEHWATLYKSRCILHNAMICHGKDNFKVERLCVVDNANLDNMEAYWAEQLETYMWDYPGGYNMVWCGEGCRRGILHSEDTKLLQSKLAVERGHIVGPKISAALKGRTMSEEQLEKHTERMNSQLVKDKISKAHSGKVISVEQRAKISETSKLFWTEEKRLEVSIQRKAVGRKMSDKSKVKLSESKIGHVVSDETREKLRAANLGKKLSEDAKHNMSLARKGKPASEAQVLGILKAKARRFNELFDKHYTEWLESPDTKKRWKYNMSVKRRDGTLSEEHIKKLEETPGWCWSS
jgi:hypothetical protein